MSVLIIAENIDVQEQTNLTALHQLSARDQQDNASSTSYTKNNWRYQLRISLQEGNECKNTMSLEYQCSEYSLESECKSACGLGTKDGICRWLPENRYDI